MSLRSEFAQKTLKDKNILQWIPFICSCLFKDPAKTYLFNFIKAAKSELQKNFKDLSLNPKLKSLMTREEQHALNEAEIIKNREIICYHMSLKSLGNFLKTKSRKHISKAAEWYAKGEKNWKELVNASKSFTMLNLAGRNKI